MFVRIGLTREQVDDLDNARLVRHRGQAQRQPRRELHRAVRRALLGDRHPSRLPSSSRLSMPISGRGSTRKLWKRRDAEIERARALL